MDVDKPVAGDDEVLVRVRAASMHPDVWHVVSGRPYPDLPMPTKKETIAILRELLEAGQLTPIIDSTFNLSEVREAFRHLVEDELQGKVIIKVIITPGVA